MKKVKLCLPAVLCGVLLSPAAQAQGVYAKAGFLGAGLGYSHSLSDSFSVRTDFTTVGTIKRDRSEGRLDYSARLKANQLGAYGDWFPFGNGFRLSGGLHVRKLQVDAEGRPNQAGTITINNTVVGYGPGDVVKGRVKFPTVAPYLGIGWGHHGKQEAGFGFVFDLGVAFGKPKTTLEANDSLRNKLEIAANFGGTTAAAEIEAQRRELADTADKVKFFPQLYVGVSYRF